MGSMVFTNGACFSASKSLLEQEGESPDAQLLLGFQQHPIQCSQEHNQINKSFVSSVAHHSCRGILAVPAKYFPQGPGGEVEGAGHEGLEIN